MYPIASKKNLFNLTSTFRRDSSLYLPYGMQYKLDKERQIPNKTVIMKDKSKLAVWIVSHCNADSKRDAYIKELQKYIPIDVFGRCTKKIVCHPKGGLKPCTDINIDQYKFFISAENSICKDYVTGQCEFVTIPSKHHSKSFLVDILLLS